MVAQFMPTSLHALALMAAWGLAVYAGFIQLAVVRRLRASEREAGLGWWFGGSLCLGTGLWAESFITTLSVQLPVVHGYMLPLVAASWLPAVMVAGLSIWLLSQTRTPRSLCLLGTLIISAVLGGVSMLSISSILLKPALQWDERWLALGFGTMAMACCLGHALSRHAVLAARSWPRDLALAAMLATLLRLGHLAVLEAAQFPAGAHPLGEDLLAGDKLVPLLWGVTMLLLMLVHMGTVLDARHHQRQAQLAQSLAQAQQDLHHASSRDPLTQLHNRQGFDICLSDRVNAGASRLAVMLVNLDGFRPMVNHYGHAMGDQLLCQVASRLKGMVRDGDEVARAEGDEFLLLIQEPGDAHAMAQLAQRINDAISQPYLFDETDIELTCSIGVALYPDEPNPLRLIDHANEAMLAARNAGGAAHCLFQAGMEREVEKQVALQRDLRHAIERSEMLLHYQPKIDVPTGCLAGVEALLRWKHPQRGMVSPGEFIPVAERFGLIGSLGAWVLNEACRQARVWMDAGVEIPVAVNVSVHQLRQAELEQKVRDALTTHQLPPHMLVLEITESVAMENIESSLRVFNMLDRIGVQLSIDDFGTGYSSLSYLRRLPARQLKIDRCFVRDLDGPCQDARAIVEAVVRLAHALDLKVVAEGVETHGQAQALSELGCDEMQGFLYARPMPEYELLAWQVQRQTGARLVEPAKVPGKAQPDTQTADAATHAVTDQPGRARGPSLVVG